MQGNAIASQINYLVWDNQNVGRSIQDIDSQIRPQVHTRGVKNLLKVAVHYYDEDLRTWITNLFPYTYISGWKTTFASQAPFDPYWSGGDLITERSERLRDEVVTELASEALAKYNTDGKYPWPDEERKTIEPPSSNKTLSKEDKEKKLDEFKAYFNKILPIHRTDNQSKKQYINYHDMKTRTQYFQANANKFKQGYRMMNNLTEEEAKVLFAPLPEQIDPNQKPDPTKKKNEGKSGPEPNLFCSERSFFYGLFAGRVKMENRVTKMPKKVILQFASTKPACSQCSKAISGFFTNPVAKESLLQYLFDCKDYSGDVELRIMYGHTERLEPVLLGHTDLATLRSQSSWNLVDAQLFGLLENRERLLRALPPEQQVEEQQVEEEQEEQEQEQEQEGGNKDETPKLARRFQFRIPTTLRDNMHKNYYYS